MKLYEPFLASFQVRFSGPGMAGCTKIASNYSFAPDTTGELADGAFDTPQDKEKGRKKINENNVVRKLASKSL